MIKRVAAWIIDKIIPMKWFYDNPKQIANTIKDKKDDRDYIVYSSAVLSETRPAKILLKTPPIRNQGATNSCMSHAAVRAVEIMALANNKYLEGSERYHYYCARKYVNKQFPKNVGMSVRDGCRTAKEYGTTLEKACPWDESKVNVLPSKAAFWLSSIYQVVRYERISSIDAIKDTLMDGIPVVCGVWLDEAYSRLNYVSYVWRPKQPTATSKKRYGGHAQVIIGYDDNTQMFTIENSWGTRFGRNGKLEISYTDFNKVSFDYWRLIYRKW